MKIFNQISQCTTQNANHAKRQTGLLPPALVLFAALTSTVPAFSQDFLGVWTATAETPGGTVSETVKVSKSADGYAISAQLDGSVEEGTLQAGPGMDIVLEGDRFSYKRQVTVPGNVIDITYSGVVLGDTFDGKIEMFGGQIPYKGVRIKEVD